MPVQISERRRAARRRTVRPVLELSKDPPVRTLQRRPVRSLAALRSSTAVPWRSRQFWALRGRDGSRNGTWSPQADETATDRWSKSGPSPSDRPALRRACRSACSSDAGEVSDTSWVAADLCAPPEGRQTAHPGLSPSYSCTWNVQRPRDSATWLAWFPIRSFETLLNGSIVMNRLKKNQWFSTRFPWGYFLRIMNETERTNWKPQKTINT